MRPVSCRPRTARPQRRIIHDETADFRMVKGRSDGVWPSFVADSGHNVSRDYTLNAAKRNSSETTRGTFFISIVGGRFRLTRTRGATFVWQHDRGDNLCEYGGAVGATRAPGAGGGAFFSAAGAAGVAQHAVFDRGARAGEPGRADLGTLARVAGVLAASAGGVARGVGADGAALAPGGLDAGRRRGARRRGGAARGGGRGAGGGGQCDGRGGRARGEDGVGAHDERSAAAGAVSRRGTRAGGGGSRGVAAGAGHA